MAPPPLKYRPCHNPNGLVSEEALRIIVEAKACFVALALALAYFLTASQHRPWSSSHLIKGFLFAATQPVTRFLVGMFTMLLAMPFRNDLYLLWGILLLAGYEGVYTISGYCVSTRRSDLAVHEFARANNIVTLGLYVRYYSRASPFRYPLWALWTLMVAKFLERVVRFKIANARYGDANTSFVAEYMKHEDKVEVTEKSATSFSMEDCNYLVVGESKSKARPERVRSEYEAKYKPVDDTVTVAKVWKCDGELLTSSSNVPGDEDELKDVCLSFALCKLLRRKFAGVATAGSKRPKAQRLVFDNLIHSGWRRTFRVIRTELGFSRDLHYTKYPILFSSGFPVVSTMLFAVTVVVSVWDHLVGARGPLASSWVLTHYRVPHGSTSNVVRGRNVDLLITFVIAGMVTGMEICEFFIHLFSDWTKVMVISEYVLRKPWLNCRFLNCILRFIRCCKIAEPIGRSLGQLNLLKATKKRRCLPERERLRRRTNLEGYEELSRYCKARTHIERMMVWHVATSKLLEEEEDQLRLCTSGSKGSNGLVDGRSGEGQNGLEGGEGKNDLEVGRSSGGSKGLGYYKLVATTLSRYCAYLVFYKPKLLPIASNSVRYMCNELVREANSKEKPNGEHLVHQKELGKGGEFITHLRALLYHAGIDDKFSGSSTADADAAPNKEDNHGQGGSNMCSAGSI
ncbi:hypothetical protein SETIT_9G544500v2 [Setaria italica]|uniref:DUF4220 domain-containing protein n=2 Tax=Setaria italica TaxID=4555 RepID=A0A368SW34_SETIT|nr:hypothetical protein SETIT_9G544500v2 [Setaria italica]